jgi:hypothetical protein
VCVSPPVVRDTSAGIPRFYLAAPIDSIWGKLSLRVRFLDGTQQVRDRVQNVARQWEEQCAIRFQFVTSGASDIRVSFTQNGRSWSYVGTDALSIPPDEPTMNFGWLTESSSDDEYSRVVLHQFGHALGFIHEHQNPNAQIPWDRSAVIKYYTEVHGWTSADVQNNLFQVYDRASTNFSVFDPKSIMLYAIPNEHTVGDFSVGWNAPVSPSSDIRIKCVSKFSGATCMHRCMAVSASRDLLLFR